MVNAQTEWPVAVPRAVVHVLRVGCCAADGCVPEDLRARRAEPDHAEVVCATDRATREGELRMGRIGAEGDALPSPYVNPAEAQVRTGVRTIQGEHQRRRARNAGLIGDGVTVSGDGDLARCARADGDVRDASGVARPELGHGRRLVLGKSLAVEQDRVGCSEGQGVDRLGGQAHPAVNGSEGCAGDLANELAAEVADPPPL